MARLILPGMPHHVTQRGNRRQIVFFSAYHYQTYLNLLFASSNAFKFDVWSYCLMPNHVHLLLVPESEESLRDGVSYLHKMYTRAVNSAKGWKGCLWQGRFFSCAVQPAGVAAVARYIELNPVRAKLCHRAVDYRWSSAKASCDGGSDGKSGFSPIYAPVGTWAEYLNSNPHLDSEANLRLLRRAVTTGRPYGSEAYLKELEKTLGLSLLPKSPGRKSKSTSMNSDVIF